MSTNNGLPNGWPGEADIEKLANGYFKSLPGQEIKPVPDVDFGDLPLQDAGGNGYPGGTHPANFNIDDPQTSLPDPHFSGAGIPASVAGSGISPSAGARGSGIQPQQPQSSIPMVPVPGSGNIPASVAGSGMSPNAIQHPGAFNIQDPQTSLPDPHFRGINPNTERAAASTPLSFTNPFSFQDFPYIGEPSVGKVMEEILARIPMGKTAFASPIPAVADPASFYFLTEKHAGSRLFSAPSTGAAAMPRLPFDVNLIKNDFPIFRERVNGQPLIWLDNAATTQKPQFVIDRLSYFYEHENSNIHRAAHELAARATDAYEEARKKVQQFLNARSAKEIIFVRGTTEAINLVAKSWGEQFLSAGDEIILSHLEHHANIVPWQQLANKKGLKLRVIPVNDAGELLIDEYAKLLNPKTKLVSFTQVSNAVGTVTPAKQIIEMAKAAGAKVLLDGAQSVSHMRTDVQLLDCDWFVFSGHKIFGPTGIGVVYGKEELLNETQPWQGGGNMIEDVTFEHTRFQKSPARYEAGTGNIADAVGLGAALDYVMRLGIEWINQYEHFLLEYALSQLKHVPGLKFIGMPHHRAGVISLVMEGRKTEDVGAALNKRGIAVRSGHHCAQPILRRLGTETSVRPSIALYNTCSDIDALVDGLLSR